MSETEVSYSDLLNNFRLSFVLVPLSSTKEIIYNEMLKYTPVLKYNTLFVSFNKENTSTIGYDRIMEMSEMKDNYFFILDDIEMFIYYATDVFNNTKNNKYVILVDIQELKKINKIKSIKGITRDDFAVLYPKNFDLPTELVFNDRKDYIYDKQLKQYRDEYIKYKKLSYESYNESEMTEKVLGSLNVFLDESVQSLESIPLDKAMLRAPKFKSIFIDILLKNKKRHLVHMINGKYGIDSFISIYNKLDNIIPMIIIRAGDNYNDKIKKLKMFNSSNAPGILLTDYHFTGNMTPKNIDFYHLTNGGHKEDFNTIFDICKSSNYSGSYPRNFTIISHVSSTIGNELTLDEEKSSQFKDTMDEYLKLYNSIKRASLKLYLKGEEFFITTSS
jgi:hypothetical protein